MHYFVISQLLDAGLNQDQIAVFQENEIDTQDFCELTTEDLRILFPNKLGIVKKVVRVIQHVSSILLQSNDLKSRQEVSGNVSDSGCSDSPDADAGTDTDNLTFPPEATATTTTTNSPIVSNCPVQQPQMISKPVPVPVIQPDLKISQKKSALIVVELPIKRRLTVSKKNQQTLRSMMRFLQDRPAFQSKIQIDYSKRSDKELTEDQIRITALPKQMPQIVAEVQKIVEGIKQFGTQTLTIDNSLHKYLIGSNGRNIREVFDRTGVILEIPAPNTDSHRVILTGLPKNLPTAVDILRRKYERFIPTVEREPKPKGK